MKPIYEHRSYSEDIPFQAGISTDFSFFPHFHTDIEIAFVICGSMRIRMNDAQYILYEDQGIFIPPKTIHSYESIDTGTKTSIVVFAPEALGESWDPGITTQSHIFSLPAASAMESLQNFSAVKKNLLVLASQAHRKSLHMQYVIRGRILETYGLLLQLLGYERSKDDSSSHNTNELQLAHTIMEYIERNFRQPLTLSELATRFSYSYSHLSRVFKQTLGVDFTTYLNTTRLMYARSLLRQGNRSMSDICFASGFQSVRTFNRVFSLTFGLSPREYRKHKAHSEQSIRA
jgi:AraC-like DNA-binding protein